MSNNPTCPGGEKMRQALRWISECLTLYPDKTRETLLRDAHIRFDLSPRECEFLMKEFGSKKTATNDQP